MVDTLQESHGSQNILDIVPFKDECQNKFLYNKIWDSENYHFVIELKRFIK